MIKTYYNVSGDPVVKFKGDTKEIQQDITRIMWSMIEKSEDTRQALINAVEEINFAVKHIEGKNKGE